MITEGNHTGDCVRFAVRQTGGHMPAVVGDNARAREKSG